MLGVHCCDMFLHYLIYDPPPQPKYCRIFHEKQDFLNQFGLEYNLGSTQTHKNIKNIYCYVDGYTSYYTLVDLFNP